MVDFLNWGTYHHRCCVFRSHVVASSQGPLELTDPVDIGAALQVFADQFCGLALQPCNWFHPGSTDAAVAACADNFGFSNMN